VFSGGQSVVVRTYDISEGGLGIVTDASPPYGTNLSVRVRIPAGDAIPMELDARVTVARSVLSSDESGFKVGLQFVSLEPAARAAIRRFLNPD
jgi:c-di-GMP-binding flagellar brake protein YcgR